MRLNIHFTIKHFFDYFLVVLVSTNSHYSFGTINRHKILEIAGEFLSEDGARMLRVLLADTTIAIKIKYAITTPFTVKIGAPQGDSYCWPQFELYYEDALKKVRRGTEITNQKDSPEEMIYADDYDKLTEDQENNW